MRLLHIVPTYLPAGRYGGPIRSVHGLCRALAARKNDTHVYTTTIDGRFNLPTPPGGPVDLDGVRVHYFPARFPRRIYFSPLLGDAIRQHLREFDVLHLHSVFLWPTLKAAQLARKLHVPYIVTPRGMLVRHLIQARSRLAKTLWLELVEKRNLENATGIHVTSRYEAGELRKFKIKFPRIFVIPNGIDPPDESGPAEGISEKIGRALRLKPMVLYVGRLSWEKGLDRLVRAMKYLPQAHLVLAGNDDAGYGGKLLRLARQEGAAERVVLTGAVEKADKTALLHHADVMALVSLSESFGISVAEAMQAGCPVVVTPEVGAADMVRKARAGIVCEGDPRRIAEAIHRLLEDESTRRDMGKNGQRAVMAELSWNSIAEKMEREYREILSSRAFIGL